MRQLLIDSRDRVATSASSTDFSVNLPQTLTLARGQRMRVDNWRIPLTIPTIRTGVNDQLVVEMGAGNYTMTVPQGQYDGPGLAAILQSLLQATVPGIWSVVYDSSNVSMTFGCSNAFIINYGTLTKRWFTMVYLPLHRERRFEDLDVLVCVHAGRGRPLPLLPADEQSR